MAEILIKAVNATHADPTKDQRGCYKRGFPVLVMPDGHPWGIQERLPKFVVFKFPLIPVDHPTLLKYVQVWQNVEGTIVTQRRRWRIRWADLPQVTQDLILLNGGLTIRATLAYLGPFDYTWLQVKAYFRNDETGLDELVDL